MSKHISKHVSEKTIYLDNKSNSNFLINNSIDNRTLLINNIKKKNLPETYIEEYNEYFIKSNIDLIFRKIYLKKKIYQGSFNKIYNISRIKSDKIDPNLIIRILNYNTDKDSIKNEIKGIELQYNLYNDCRNIGLIIDYGKIYSNKFQQYYVILVKYGITLTKYLESNPNYLNLLLPIKFMKKLLVTINDLHSKNYAHLDIKTCNILLKNIFKFEKNPLDEIDFVLIDFGASNNFYNDKSKTIDEQSASPAFSPPELDNMKFGKKTDIWSYGIICYLVCIRQFIFKSNVHKIFRNSDKKTLYNQIEKELDSLESKLIPYSLKNESDIKKYLYPLKNIQILINFFKKIFIINYNDRPNSFQLLQDPIFTSIT